MVRSELLFAVARNEKYENDPEVIAQVKQLMVGKYLRDKLEPKLAQLKATEQESEAYYYAHPAEFGSHAMVHAALIRIAVSPKATGEKRAELLKRAESARAEAMKLEAGVPAFGNVALKYSEDQSSRYRGGDVGWLQSGTTEGGLDRKVTDAIFALKAPGQVSPVVAAADGYYIVKLMETKGATVKPFAEVKEGVRYQVIQEKRKKVEQDFIEQLKNRIPVSENRGLLQTIDPPGEGTKAGPPALPAR
jgi:parvulin-like peptidyl-prolyl isomerase